MSYRKICNLGYPRQHAPDNDKWWNAGELWYNDNHDLALVVMYGLATGIFHGRRDDQAKFKWPSEKIDPYIQGRLAVTIKSYKPDDRDSHHEFSQPCGRIITSETNEGLSLYTVTLELLPCKSNMKDREGLFFRVEHDHKDYGKQNNQN